MKSIGIIFLYLFISLSSFSQQGGWEKFYNNNGAMRAQDIKPTSDGGYIMTGFSNPTNTLDGQDIMLMKIDGDGNFEWSNNFNPGGSTEYGWSLIETFDQEFALVGSASSPLTSSTDGYFILTDEHGNVKNQWFIGDSQTNFLTDIIQLPTDSSFVACGEWGDRPCIVRMDKYGDTLFTKIYPEVLGRFNALEYSPEDQTICLAGISVPLQKAGLVAKIDVDGNVIWLHEYIGGGFEELYDLTIFDDRIFTVGRSRALDPNQSAEYHLRTLDLTTGDTENVTGYGFSNSFVFQSVTVGQMSNLTMIGTKINNLGISSVSVFSTQINFDGEIIWDNLFGGNQLASSYGSSICHGHDYGYILSGQCTSTAGVVYVYVIKIDENGSVVSTNSFPFLPEISLYPNPCSEVLNIQLGQFESEKRITVFNSAGQEVYEKTTFDNEIQINEVGFWPSGVYLVHVEVEGHKVVRKVAVE